MHIILPKSKILAILLFFIVFLFGNVAKSATITSTGAGGLWSVGSSWVGNVVPSATDDVVIASGATITVDGARSAKTINIRGILLFNANNTSVNLPANGTINIVSPGNIANNGCSNNMEINIGGSKYAACQGNGNSPYTFQTLNTAGGNCPTSAGTLSGYQYICTSNSKTTTFSSTVPGGTWSSSNTSIATVNASTGVITSDWTNYGTVTITYTVGGTGGCTQYTASRTVYVATVQPTSLGQISYNGTPYSNSPSPPLVLCKGSTSLTFSIAGIPNVSGYVWRGDSTWIITPSADGLSAVVVFPANANQNNIEVYAQNGCGNGIQSYIYITLNSPSGTAPTITSQPSTATQTACLNGTVSAISVTASGSSSYNYQWYSNTTASNSGGTLISGATSQSYTPPTNVAGDKYYYCVVGGTCSPTVTSNVSGKITVNATPTAVAGGSNSACQSAFPAAITLSGASVGGSATTGAWSISGGGGGTLSTSLQTNTPGTVTYTPAANYTGTVTLILTSNAGTGCTAATSNRTINVIAKPTTATVGVTQNICGSLTSAVLGGNTPSVGTGSWSQFSGPGTSTFSSVNLGSSTVTASLYGAYVYRWTISNGSCTSATDITVNYYANPTTATVGTTQNICASLTTASLGGNVPTVGTGTWTQFSGPGTSSFSTVNTGASTATASVVGTYVYRWTISNGSCMNTADVTVNYYTNPTLTVPNPVATCSPNTVDLTAPAITAGSTASLTYTYWTNAGASITYGTPAVATAGNYYIKGTSAAGCFVISPVTVTINPAPTLTTATQPIFACNDSEATIKLTGLLPNTVSTISYTITGDAPQTIAVTADGSGVGYFDTRKLTVLANDNGKTLQITGVSTSSCSTTGLSINVTLNVQSNSGAITMNGSTIIPSGSSTSYSELSSVKFSIDNIAGATGYLWDVPPGWIITAGDGTREITVTTGSYDERDITVSVTANNLCPSAITVDLSAIPPSAPAANAIVAVSCNQLGSVTFNNLPDGSWTLTRIKGVNSTDIPGSGNTLTVNNLAAGDYTFKITTPRGATVSGTINVPDMPSTTWNGGSSWSNGLPNDNTKIILNASGTLSGIIEGCSCEVNSNKHIIFASLGILKLKNELNVDPAGSLTFKDKASLYQFNDEAVNSGIISYERTTLELNDLDYVYWSSPVADQKLGALYDSDRYFKLKNGAWDAQGKNDLMEVGTGYIIRVRKNAPIFHQTVNFIGEPNNGIKYVLSQGINKSNLIGNPYPSAIDADEFLLQNQTLSGGTLYFWSHFTVRKLDVNSSEYRYSSADYATYNISGGTAPLSTKDMIEAGVALTPSGQIASGQSFFVTSDTADPSFEFNNSMRLDTEGTNSQFFKQSNTKKTGKIKKDRVWLNLSNDSGAFKQLLVGYITGATNDYDKLYDGVTRNGNEYIDFYSVNNSKNYTIQGRTLPFDTADEVPLGYKTTIEGTFNININNVDGGLVNQTIYLEDKLTNTIHDLKSGPYPFTTAIGTFNNRFVLRYTNTSKLGTGDVEVKGKGVFVSVKNREIKINSFDQILSSVKVFDLKGSLLYERNKVNKNEFIIDTLTASSQFMVVMVQLEDGKWISEEIIFHD
jgi:hypothetical protein